MATDQELKSLIVDRGLLKAALTRFHTYKTNFREDDSTSNLRLRKANFALLLNKFDAIQSRIEIIDSSPSQMDERTAFEDAYYSLLSWADDTIEEKEKIKSRNENPSVVRIATENNEFESTSVQVKLPMVHLPSFDGTLENWLPFHDSFMALIHSDPRLSNIQKYHYLKSCLTDRAAKAVECLPLSSENYQVALDVLKARYASTKLIVKTHVTAIFNLPVVAKNSVSSLRELVDAVTAHVKALTNLQLPTDQWDTLLIHIVVSKLDYATTREWEMTMKDDEVFPTFTQLIEFLNSKCKLLECMNTVKSPKREYSIVNERKTTNTKVPSTRAYLSTTNKPHCNYCKQTHYITQCKDFLKLSVESRITECKRAKLCPNCLKCNHTANHCQSLNTCKLCNRRHHTLLHITKTQQDIEDLEPQPSTSVANYCNATSTSVTMLSTAVVHLLDRKGNKVDCRALLDPGSESSFITNSMCNKLGITLRSINHTIVGITQGSSHVSKIANVSIHSKFNAFAANLDCLVLPLITASYPRISLKLSDIKIPENLKLADPEFYKAKSVDLLIGAELFWSLLNVGQVKTDAAQPYLHKTVFGWVVGGNLLAAQGLHASRCHLTIIESENLHNCIKKFWELENCANNQCNKLSREERACEEHFVNTYKRDETGRFVVKLPFKVHTKTLGSSETIALKRFQHLERRFSKNPSLKENYSKCLQEYLMLGHMERVVESSKNAFYLPHHAVIKIDSLTTKTRVVFDGSAKGENGVSLNDCLMIGPPIQNDLFSIITRFRTYKYVFSADIVKMYRQILIDADHRQFQRIFWRENSNEPIQTYQLNTVTYGTASAPFLALRCIQQLAYDHIHQYPEACKVILSDFYVDDVITGANNLGEIRKIRDQIVNILETAKFELNKWASNNSTLLPSTEGAAVIINLDKQGDTKTLGLHWNCNNDVLRYSTDHIQRQKLITKRSILSAIAQLYDPLGLVSPAVITAKLIMQKLWNLKVTWDESVPVELHTKWTQFINELPNLNELAIPRMVLSHQNPRGVELHGFCDASERAYGACIYLKSIDGNRNNATVNLLCAKSRVAPLKPITLPRLELCAALLLANLVSKVRSALNIIINRQYFWSDSSITLAWLSSPANRWKTFIANRVAEIQNFTSPADWRHISSEQNPADILSRGTAPSALLSNNLWWHGPEWLRTDSNLWPISKISFDTLHISESKITTLAVIDTYSLPVFKKYSSYTKLQRVLAYVLRFIYNSRHKTNKLSDTLTKIELDQASTIIIKHAQHQMFGTEIADLKNKRPIQKKSSLLSLNPFLDDNGVLRVGGRLKHANLKYERKFPILLPPRHHITLLLIKNEHLRLLHAGNEATLNSLRQRFWPVAGRSAVRKIIRKCIKCFRAKPIMGHQIMGDLPVYRVQQARPFLNTGVDFAGPLLIRELHGRGKRTHKAYIALFVCFATKAIHLELVSNLTSEAFLNALKRFISRRGAILNLYSDNATNFIGAKRELEHLEFLFKQNNIAPEISNELATHGITWHFIPPRSPHFGGIWEAGIKSVKGHLKRVVGESILTYEELHTLLTRIEACLNSRPLTSISTDPNDLTALTPAHFLIGDLLTAPAEPNVEHLKLNTLSRWQYIERLRQHFWKRWHNEYVHTLQQRAKWTSTGQQHQPQIGALVVIKEENASPLHWKLGRITSTHPGHDGVVRVVTLKTASGVIKRAVSRVSVLPIAQDD